MPVSACCPIEPGRLHTLFSQARFAKAIARASGNASHVIELRSEKSRSNVFAVETISSLGRRSVALAPFGLYAHPAGSDDLDTTVKDIIRQLKTYSTTTFQWSVRFDHAALAQALARTGLPFSRPTTHVLPLQGNYETSFAKFNSTTRNLVRRVHREGIVMRSTQRGDDIRAYYEVHTKLASEKGYSRSLYPKAMFDELVKLDEDVVFVVAEVQKKIAAGAWLFRDGDTFLYWHAAMDRTYSRQSPSYAIVDYAIRMAHEEGRKAVNFGGSSGIASLEDFKAKWGAEPQCCWCFDWQNPVWQVVQKVRNVWGLRRLHA
jgi:Acetyltransferase (GNAT) domain